MTVNELIAELEKLRDEHDAGGLSVWQFAGDEGDTIDYVEILEPTETFRLLMGDQRHKLGQRVVEVG